MKWNNAQESRPEHNRKIIFESYFGLYWGIYLNKKEGVVLIENKPRDAESWLDIDQWIYYPEN